jgi:hypothetical protein
LRDHLLLFIKNKQPELMGFTVMGNGPTVFVQGLLHSIMVLSFAGIGGLLLGSYDELQP